MSTAKVPSGAEECVLQAQITATDRFKASHRARDDRGMGLAIAALMMFHKVVLATHNGQNPRAGRLADRCKRWMDGDWEGLWNDAEAEARELARTRHERQQARAARETAPAGDGLAADRRPGYEAVACAYLRKGQISRAMGVVDRGNHGATQIDDVKLNQARELHPPRSTDGFDQAMLDFWPQERITLEFGRVWTTLRQLKDCTAPGASGMRCEHLKVWLSNKDVFQDQLMPIMQAMADGSMPESCLQFFGDSMLVLIDKPDGGIRPIALLECLRNLVGRLVLRGVMDDLRASLKQFQLAVGIKGGVEAVIHGVRGVLEQCPEWGLLQVDFENMFNEISRDGVLNAVMRRCPRALPFVRALYCRESTISLRVSKEQVIAFFCESQQGVFQGDALGTALACCLLADFQDALKQHMDDNSFDFVQLAIADDLSILGDPAALQCAYGFITSKAPSKRSGLVAPEPWALKCRESKCKLYRPRGLGCFDDAVAPGGTQGAYPIHASVERCPDGVRCVGAPVGSAAFCESFCQELVTEKYAVRLQRIAKFPDTQSALLFLRFCHVTRFVFVTRTTPPSLAAAAAEQMDASTRDALDHILGLASQPGYMLDAQDWAQAQLSIKAGGLGLWSSLGTRYAAFAGSVALTLSQLVELEQGWPECCRGIFSRLEEERLPIQQHMMDALRKAEAEDERGRVDALELKRLAEHDAERARLADGDPDAAVAQPPAAVQHVFPTLELLKATRIDGLQKKVSEQRSRTELRGILEGFAEAHARAVASDDADLARCARRDMARVLSCSGPGAGGFLTALPTWSGKMLAPPDMLDSVRRRLGLKVPGCEDLIGIKCNCGVAVVDNDASGSHMLTCSQCGGHFWRGRSWSLQSCMLAIGKDAGLAPRLEQIVGEELDRTDVTFPDMPVERDELTRAVTRKDELHIDVAIVAAHCDTALGIGSWHNKGKWADKTAKTKTAKYVPQMGQGQRFAPAVAEVHGHLHSDFRKLLRDLAECKVDQSDRDSRLSTSERNMLLGIFVNDLYQLVSVAVQKGTAMNVRNVRSLLLAHHSMQGHRSRRRAPRVSYARALSFIGSEERFRTRAF